MDLRRSSSTNTHCEQNSVMLQQVYPHMWQNQNQKQLSLTAQNLDVNGRVADVQRWSGCSGSTHSRSSTPETIVWRGGSSRPSRLSQEVQAPAAPDSPMSKLTATEDESFLENNELSFQFPSPIPSSVSLAETNAPSEVGSLVEEVIEDPNTPGDQELPEGGGERSPKQTLTPPSPGEGQEPVGEVASVCHLEVQWQSELMCPAGRTWKSPLVSSLSDSPLGERCRCREGITKAPKMEEGTMTSQLELVDAEVQTISPIGSWWDLKRNMSTTGSQSILGSPPGSRLNLKSSVGSNSNLVSPSSSMFPVSSGEEEEKQGDDPTWDVNSASLQDLEGRRSCLKIQGDDRDELGRRSSMKQVQWDENGMTWEVHGASVDPEVLSTAIKKHLELQNSPQPLRRSSKKKRAPKPPIISNVMKAMAPEPNPPTIVTSSEAEGVGAVEAHGGKQVEEEGGGKKEETMEVARRISRAEREDSKEGEEVYGEEGSSHSKSPSRGGALSRKKSVIRSLRRPGWCGGSNWPKDCGMAYFKPNMAERIVSGNEARPHSWPWQVSLQVMKPTKIRGKAEDAGSWRIVLGKHRLKRSETAERIFPVKRIYRHENFRYPTHSELDYDIALVKAGTDILPSNFIRYACLPRKQTSLKPGHYCWVTGWGDTRGGKENVSLAEALNQARLPIIDFKTCRQKKFWGDRVRDSMICAGFRDTEDPPAACQGDSGGPLLCQLGRDRWEVHGVVSFGPIGCTVENKPSVFTRTAAYIPWIEATRIRDFFLH
ncbi:hypothetical protein INR49_027283 [Caranx melampygus]|nr:hypothetical protein INR49_027283 [Caranx melampygus]